MTDILGSVRNADLREAPEQAATGDPFARLLAGVQVRRASAATSLKAIVESSVLPELYATHRKVCNRNSFRQNHLHQAAPQLIVAHENALGDAVTTLGDRLLANDHAGACGTVEALRIEGRSLECIYLKLLSPTASHLHRMWDDDLCGLAETTLAMLNLQSVLRHFAPAFRAERQTPDNGHRTLLVSPKPSGLDVTAAMFGLMMVSEFFRRGGWESWIEPDLSGAAFDDAVRHQWFDVVELLVANDGQLDRIASSIRMIRRGSANQAVGVIVCGQVFVDHPEFVRMVGADLTAPDPSASLIQANDFISLSTPPARLR